MLCLSAFINVDSITECKKYQKMIYQNCRFTTRFYSKGKKMNDSVFETKDNRSGIITSMFLINYDDKYDVFVFFKLLKLVPVTIVKDRDVKNILNLKKCLLSSNDTQCIDYSRLHRPCIISKCNNSYYLSSIVKGAIGCCIN